MKASYSSSESGIGGQFVQQRIAQPKRRLRTSRRLLLAQDVGDVIGAESARRGGFFDGAGHGFRAVLPDQFQQFAEIWRASERSVSAMSRR